MFKSIELRNWAKEKQYYLSIISETTRVNPMMYVETTPEVIREMKAKFDWLGMVNEEQDNYIIAVQQQIPSLILKSE